jgi:D-alanyl-D-alanine carboxypeptidase
VRGKSASLVALAAVASVGSASASARPAASPAAVLQQQIARFAATHPTFPGVALAVVGPKISWSGAAGLASRSPRTPLRADAGFRIASVTKTFTAAAVLRLVEQGKVGLDDPIAERVSAATAALLRSGGYDPGAIRVRHLLQHTSGLYDYADDTAFQTFVVAHPRHRWTRLEQVRFAVRNGKPLFAPGTDFHYSDTGYVLLGEIVERATGRAQAPAYRSLLGFDRLGLRSTYFETLEPASAGASPRAHQFLGALDTTGFDPSFDLYGGGGLVSTVDDLVRFYRALFAGRVFEHAATLGTMLGRPNATRPSDLGMGIFPESIGREACWHHDGFWGTSVVHCPRAGITIAVTVNQANGFDSGVQQLEAAVLRVVARS